MTLSLTFGILKSFKDLLIGDGPGIGSLGGSLDGSLRGSVGLFVGAFFGPFAGFIMALSSAIDDMTEGR